MTWREVLRNLLTGVSYLPWGRVQTSRIDLSDGLAEYEAIVKDYLDELGPPPGMENDVRP